MNLFKCTGERRDVLKGAVAGFVGGLVAAFVMSEFQSLLSKLKSERPEKKSPKTDEPATVKVAEAISDGAFGHELAESEKSYAGEAVHYAMGGATGAIYGAVSEMIPMSRIGSGLPFGAAVWLFADEIAVPALGFAKPPVEYPLSTHAYALASHFVYGLSTEVVRSAVRNAL